MSAVIGSLRAELEAEMAQFREDMGKAGAAVEEFQRRAQQAGNRLDRYNRRVGQTEQSMDRLAQRVQQVSQRFGRFMTVGLTAPIVAIGTAAVRTAGQFEESMNRVGALTGATGEDFEMLRRRAREMGEQTQHTASEAAQALGFLSMAGLDVREQYEALPGVLNVAAAAQMDLARTADLVTNIMTGYRMEVSQLPRINDALTKTFTSTNTNLEQLAQGMVYAGPLAAGLGLQFEETAAALGLLASAGYQAEQGGTVLRTALARMFGQSQVIEKLRDMGIATRDASGEVLNLADILVQLEPHANDAGVMMELFGVRAGPGMMALLGQGSEALRELTGEILEAGGITERVAERQMEGFNGQLRRLRSAVEALLISIADAGLLDAITEFALRLTELVRRLNETNPETLKMVTIAAALLAAIGPLALALAGLIRILRGLAIMVPIVTAAITALSAGMRASALSARGLASRLLLLWGAWEAGQAIGRSEPMQRLGEELGYMWARYRLSAEHGREAVDAAIDRVREQNRVMRENAESADEAAQGQLDLAEATEEVARRSPMTAEELQALIDSLNDLDDESNLTERQLDSLLARIDPVAGAVRDYARDLREAALAGADMTRATRVLAEQAVASAGGWEEVLKRVNDVPAAMRAAAEALRDQAFQEGAQRLVAQVDGLDRQVRRLASDALPPLERELAQIDDYYGDLADTIRENIRENEQYAGSSALAAQSVARLRAQLVEVEDAHQRARQAAQGQARALSAVDDAFAALDASRIDSDMRRLRDARGDLGFASAAMRELADLEEELSTSRLRALADIRALEADLQEARRVGDEENIARLSMLLERQREYYGLLEDTTARQIQAQRELQQLVGDLQQSVRGAMYDLISGLQESGANMDFGEWARDFMFNMRRALNEYWAGKASDWLFDFLGFGSSMDVQTINADSINVAGGLGGGGEGGGGGLFGALGGIFQRFRGFFADGGRIPSGSWGVVGEQGPELAFAGAGGLNIVPTDSGGGAGNVIQNWNITTPDPNGFRRSQRQILQEAKRSLD